MSRARPMIDWLLIVAGRTKLTDSSDDATETPAGAPVSTAQESGRSATNAIVPARNTPAPDCHQTLAGIDALATPIPASDRRRPVSFAAGGSGRVWSMKARSISSPDFSRTSGPQTEPRGGSRRTIGTGLSATCGCYAVVHRTPCFTPHARVGRAQPK